VDARDLLDQVGLALHVGRPKARHRHDEGGLALRLLEPGVAVGLGDPEAEPLEDRADLLALDGVAEQAADALGAQPDHGRRGLPRKGVERARHEARAA
jgi:hypothetical protein